jgi:hypothetical protein
MWFELFEEFEGFECFLSVEVPSPEPHRVRILAQTLPSRRLKRRLENSNLE